ncbi:MAG: exo-alpha-sialidase [Tepidisphaerales bacterium]
MMTRLMSPAVLLLWVAISAAAQSELVDVFTSGKDFPSVRIPSLIVTKGGALLAFAEGRAKAADQAQNKLILRRSEDSGRTWLAVQVLFDDGRRSINNPCAVVDQKTGRVMIMVQSYPETASEFSGRLQAGVEGELIVRSYLLSSDDEGKTWSKPRDVMAQVKRPEKVTTLSSGPGVGIQLKQGPHAGRILIPFNEGPPSLWRIYAAYSDDGGGTWKIGETAPDAGFKGKKDEWQSTVNETQVVELADGSVRLNTRQYGPGGVRKTAISRDGGQIWSAVEPVPELRVPSCMASIIRYPDAKRNLLLYSGPLGTRRENGTIFLSEDDGATWKQGATIYAKSFAYSCLAVLPDGSVGVLFERDGYGQVTFVRLTVQSAIGK